MYLRDIAWYGCRPDLPDVRDRIFAAAKVDGLPDSLDLRANCPPIRDQGATSSCTGFGITEALEFCMIKAGQELVRLSPMQLYFDERVAEDAIAVDGGAEIRTGIKCASKLGVAHESLWPFIKSNLFLKPTPEVYQDALQFKALTYERVDIDITALKYALLTGFPVVIGLSLYSSFESDAVTASGVVPMPDVAHEEVVGGHCMLCVGWRPGYFIVQNSWGPEEDNPSSTPWGDNGFCYLPEAYLGSPSYASDFWLIKSEGRT